MVDGSHTRMGRRAFVASAVGMVALGTSIPGTAQGPATTAVDQNAVRRRGVGLRGLDIARACPGLTLFAPMGGSAVHLIDLHGTVVHSWNLPYPPGLYRYLTGRGTLFYNGKLPNATFIGKSPFNAGVAMEVDWNGKILWEVRRPGHHHDGRLLKNGNIILLCAAELPEAIAARVRGGRPGTEADGKTMWADYLVEMTTDGNVVWQWRSWDHLDPLVDVVTASQDERAEWTHGNSVFEEPDGNLLVSFRAISTVVRIDRASGNILWKLGAPPLSGQHAPYRLTNGNILIFDNGPHRLDESFPFSRVIEVDPTTKAIVWTYREPRPFNFFSPRISNAQRLPNGNTLVNEGNFGRFFEVTSEGDIVWEYVNPYFGPSSAPAKSQENGVFRVYRYPDEEIARARSRI